MRTPDALEALAEVAAAFTALGVRWYVGGSVASSARGVARASLDVDVVADLRPAHAGPLATRLRQTCYMSEDAVRDAIRERRSFNIVHLPTALKIDVFIPQERTFDRAALERAVPLPLDPEGSGPEYPVASSEDVVLAKLEWYRAGGETSERRWNDLRGIVRVRGAALDLGYLRKWAPQLGVQDPVERLLGE